MTISVPSLLLVPLLLLVGCGYTLEDEMNVQEPDPDCADIGVCNANLPRTMYDDPLIFRYDSDTGWTMVANDDEGEFRYEGEFDKYLQSVGRGELKNSLYYPFTFTHDSLAHDPSGEGFNTFRTQEGFGSIHLRAIIDPPEIDPPSPEPEPESN